MGSFFQAGASTYPINYNNISKIFGLTPCLLVRLHNKINGIMIVYLCTTIFTERDRKKRARQKTAHSVPPQIHPLHYCSKPQMRVTVFKCLVRIIRRPA